MVIAFWALAEPLERKGRTISARIARGLHQPCAMLHHGPCVPSKIGPWGNHLDVMTDRTQTRDKRGIKAVLKFERRGCFTPGLAQEPARRADRLL